MPSQFSCRLLVLFALASVLQVDSLARSAEQQPGQVTKYVRFQAGETTAYGLVEGDRVRQLEGDLFASPKRTETTHALKDVKLLVPSKPTQVFAMAGNYKSHLSGEIPEKFRIPQIFYKTISSLVEDGGYIVIPKDAQSVHYEAEMVIVIGKKASKVPKDKALDYVFGVTCGNDVSARVWQKGDVQWWRAKGSDTFGPCGPYLVSGLDYDDLLMKLRVNGQEKQNERTNLLIHDVATMVSYISQYVTMQPGDLIFTGTPGKTSDIKPGDVVEVELEGVGTLTNRVTGEE